MHRDIKPDNFLVTEDGDVKLIDFALAQRIRTGLSRLFAGRTKVQGTRSYMAPEQIRGKPLDGRTDVYSFGCMLYELLSGKAAVHGHQPGGPVAQTPDRGRPGPDEREQERHRRTSVIWWAR